MVSCEKYPLDAQVTRPGAITLVLGREQEGAPNVFNIKASVQPITGKDLALVPEADRARRHLDVFTETELQVHDIIEQADFPGKFEVQTVQKWSYTKLAHYEARVVQLDEA